MRKVKLLIDDWDLIGREAYVDVEFEHSLIVHVDNPLEAIRVSKNDIEWLDEANKYSELQNASEDDIGDNRVGLQE